MIFNTKNCTGCKTCEIACSFHHTKGSFSTSLSSIKTIDKPKELGFALQLYKKEKGGHLACDRCEREEEPICVKYCPTIMRDELRGIIEEFWGKPH